jgi:hypothetical protein
MVRVAPDGSADTLEPGLVIGMQAVMRAYN